MLGAVSCSTEKDSWIHRGYHDMTAHYNGYFNARELIKETRNSYEAEYTEDYTTILPVYIYPDNEGVSSFLQPMEAAVEKTSVVITKHSMPNAENIRQRKKTEYCKWIDDNWLVMGQANFFARDFEEAVNIFKYVKGTYPSQSIIYNADLWLAKCAIEVEDYGTALSILELTEETALEYEKNPPKKPSKSKSVEYYDIARPIGRFTVAPEPPKHFLGELYQTKADMHLRKEEWGKATESLENAIKHTKNKKTKTRLTFILAQVYEEMGDKSSARNYYELVTKMTAPYEMEFYATIYKALLYDGGDTRGLRAQLLKMIKDEKNKDYLDQIYFVLAELDLAEGNKEGGIENLKLSAKNSTSNSVQKAKTYLRLGDIYYDDKSFPKAKTYYDSTLTVIDQQHENYDQIVERSEGLTALVRNLDIYETQDSLLTLVYKGEKHYLRVIDDIIEEKRKKDEEEFEARQNMPSTGDAGGGVQDFGSGANWYFYNEQAKAFGAGEFKRTWGDRPLEDDWRRSDKSSEMITGIQGDEEETPNAPENDPYAREYYLKNLPLTDSAVDSSHTLIASALYQLGIIYKDKLNEPKTSNDYFEELVKRYGGTESSLAARYQLYLAYKGDGNFGKSDIHKNVILDDYPDSEYAKIIKNPNFKKEEEIARKKHGTEYDKTFDQYIGGAYPEVISKCDEVVARRESNDFIPKYLLLKAYALGQEDADDLDPIQQSLEKLVADYGETEEGIKAKRILERLKNQSSIQGVSSGSSNYIYNSEMEHFFVLVFPNDGSNINPVKRGMADFNGNNFASKNLKIRNTFIGKDDQIVVVRSFPNKEAAQNYLKIFKKDTKDLRGISDKYEYFVITHKNYASLFIEKDLEGYREFYQKNYSN